MALLQRINAAARDKVFSLQEAFFLTWNAFRFIFARPFYGQDVIQQMDAIGVHGVIERILQRVADRPVYVSVDVDVLDPAFAPGTGTPEAGGLTSRELLAILRGLSKTNLIGADIVEVAAVYDHAQITGVAASHIAFELISCMASVDGIQ